jgi:peptide-methionine (S)-S-oxide reductase
METAVFGGGCFWCTEAIFRRLRGVAAVEPGYAGGDVANPSYHQVSSGNTGHAEVIKIDYDPAQITFDDLLTVFFATHDPTTPNQQGADIGTQYRSTVLYSTPEQKAKAEQFIAELNQSGGYTKPIVTTIEPLGEFYPAEDYHREYYEKNKNEGYCQVVIRPKIEKLEARFQALLKTAA